MSIARDCERVTESAGRATEFHMTGYNPAGDLTRRGREWGLGVLAADLASLCRFAAALAETEATGWAEERPEVATRAYESRRFLLGDRIAHWAVPWLDVAGRCHPDVRVEAHRARDGLLELGDRSRVAPAIAGHEGITLPGEDSFGPIDHDRPVGSLQTGTVMLEATWDSLGGEDADTEDLATLYETAAHRWSSLADAHPGTARLWLDLAGRAERTATSLRSP